MTTQESRLPLKPLVWHDASGVAGVYSEKTESYIKDALWFCSTLVAEYVIRESFVGRKFIANYGGRTDNFFNTVEEAKEWCEFTHYKDKMKPYVESVPTWIGVKDALPKETGYYLTWNGFELKIQHWNENGWLNLYDAVLITDWMKLPKPPSKGVMCE